MSASARDERGITLLDWLSAIRNAFLASMTSLRSAKAAISQARTAAFLYSLSHSLAALAACLATWRGLSSVYRNTQARACARNQGSGMLRAFSRAFRGSRFARAHA